MTLRQQKTLLVLFLGLLMASALFGQPEPCDITNPQMTSTCAEACIICDVDGFTGRHDSNIEGSLPGDFCTQAVHNAQWIAFQASSTSLKIELSVSNCQLGSGLEMAIYRSIDCNNFTLISNCRGAMNAVPEGATAEFETIEPLVIGQHYYLAMDGNRGDNCDWTLNVIEGSTEVAALTTTAPIAGEDRFCPGIVQTYTTDPEIGAVIFDWTLDGQVVGSPTTPSVDIDLDTPGFYELCVTARNTCTEADPVCKEIEVYVIPATIIVDEFCATECYEIDGNTFCESGLFTYSISLSNGCDSTIVLNLTKLEQPVNNTSVNICDGDTLRIGNNFYSISGSFSDTVLTNSFCDSIINLDLNVVTCNIQTTHITQPSTCFGEANGLVTFSVDQGTGPFTFDWQHLQTDLQGTGSIANTGENTIIPNLPAGQVVIEINDNFGNANVLIVQIDESELLETTAIIVEHNGFDVSCHDSADGGIELSSTGGEQPYNYVWSNGDSGPLVSNLEEGTYTMTLTDSLGCELTQVFNLIGPPELMAEVLFTDPNCDGLETGEIDVVSVEGGKAPYMYSINSAEFSEVGFFDQLPPNDYLLTITDVNNCTFEIGAELVAPEIPILFGNTEYSTLLGCELQIDIATNLIAIQNINWEDTTYLNCGDCLQPEALPLNSGINRIVVSSFDNCTDTLTINIEVEKPRQFYAPTAFSPNGDSNNDRFSLYGGKSVESIDLQIFSRWGSVVFKQSRMQPVDEQRGWDGTFNGETAHVGVYVWLANIQFIDGHTELFSGDINLMK